jgi:hypothetical protein
MDIKLEFSPAFGDYIVGKYSDLDLTQENIREGSRTNARLMAQTL